MRQVAENAINMKKFCKHCAVTMWRLSSDTGLRDESIEHAAGPFAPARR